MKRTREHHRHWLATAIGIVVMSAFMAQCPPTRAAALTANDAASGNWTSNSTWSFGGGTPAAGPNNDSPNAGDTWTVTLDSQAVTLDSNAVRISGLTLNNTSASLDTNGNTLTVDGAFSFSCGSTTGVGTVVANSGLVMSTADPGPVNATTLDVHNGGSLVVTSTSRRLTNNGTINLKSGTFTVGASAREIFGTGTWNISSGATFSITATSNYRIDGTFNNSGGTVLSPNATWTYGSGTHNGTFTGQGFLFNGTTTFQSGASVATTGNANFGNAGSGGATFAAGSSLAVGGTMTVAGASTFNTPVSAGALVVSVGGGNSLDGSGDITVGGTVTFNGGNMGGTGTVTAGGLVVNLAGPDTNINTKPLNISGNSSFTSSMSSRIFTNNGTISLLGGTMTVNTNKSNFMAGTGTLAIGSGATVVRSGLSSTITHANTTTNAGTFTMTVGTNTMSGAFANTGTVSATNGAVLNFTGAYTQTSGALLAGSGSTVRFGNGSGNVTIGGGVVGGSGTLDVGTLTMGGGTFSPGMSTGTTSVAGNLELGVDSPTLIEIGGLNQGAATNGYDYIAVSGTAALGGSLLAVLVDDTFVPTRADSFTVLTASTLNATTFADSAAVPDGRLADFAVAYTGGNSVVLSNLDLFPVAEIARAGSTGGLIFFDGSGSYDPQISEDSITEYAWDLTGSGIYTVGTAFASAAFGAGVHTVWLRVADDAANRGYGSLTFAVPEPSSLLLAVLGVAVLGLRRGRRET